MKKISKILCSALILCTAMTCCFVGCGKNQSSILGFTIASSTKTNYIVGENVKATDGAISVTYEDGTITQLPFSTAGLTISLEGEDKLSFPEQRTAVITYKNKTCKYPINVTAGNNEVLVTNVSTLNSALNNNTINTIYLANGTYNYDALTISRDVKLIGQSTDGVIISKSINTTTSHINLTSDNVYMEKLTFKGNKVCQGLYGAGDKAYNSFILKNINITSYTYGIYLADNTTTGQNELAKEMIFENVNSSKNENYGAYIGRVTTTGIFTNCNMSDNKARGLTICTMGGGTYDIKISGGNYNNNGGDTVYGNRGIHLCLDHYITVANYNNAEMIGKVLVENVTAT
ncbi:MAG: bacterial Ig-like domain-containing protein, partial [Clostridia bacterium]